MHTKVKNNQVTVIKTDHDIDFQAKTLLVIDWNVKETLFSWPVCRVIHLNNLDFHPAGFKLYSITRFGVFVCHKSLEPSLLKLVQTNLYSLFQTYMEFRGVFDVNGSFLRL